jgi:methionyl-tRNA formyltransferase
MALVRELTISEDETTGTLTDRLAVETAEAIADAVDAIAADTLRWTEQDHARATLAPKIERDDAELHFSKPASQLALRVRAMAPKPGAFTQLDGELLRIHEARVATGVDGAAPGTVRRTGDEIRIACGEDALVPLRLQRAGGKTLASAEFLRGRDIADGTLLGVSGHEE